MLGWLRLTKRVTVGLATTYQKVTVGLATTYQKVTVGVATTYQESDCWAGRH